jgi:hypothetical protein
MSSQFGINRDIYISEIYSPEAKRDKIDWAEEDTEVTMSNKRGREARRESQESGVMNQDLKSVLEAIEGLKKSLDEIKTDIAALKSLSDRVTRTEKSVGMIRNELNQVLIDSVKKWVVIKGLKKHANAQRVETRSQTWEVLEDFKVFLGANVTFGDYMRLPDFIQGQNVKTGIIRAEFLTMDDKYNFFNKLSGASGKPEFKGVSVDQELPRFLIPQKKLLETEAYNLRRTEQVKTRVIIKRAKLILQKRAKVDGSSWVTVGADPFDNRTES